MSSPEAVSIVDILKREKRTSNYFLAVFMSLWSAFLSAVVQLANHSAMP